MREAKTRTTWTEQDAEYEREVQELGRAALASEEVAAILDSWTRRTAAVQRAAILGQKLVQLTMPGVPDVYQGNESVDLSLVDPDNRREVDHAAHAARLGRMIEGARPGDRRREAVADPPCAGAAPGAAGPVPGPGRHLPPAAHHDRPCRRLRPRERRGTGRGGHRRHPARARTRPARRLGREPDRPARGPLARRARRRGARGRDGPAGRAAGRQPRRAAGARRRHPDWRPAGPPTPWRRRDDRRTAAPDPARRDGPLSRVGPVGRRRGDPRGRDRAHHGPGREGWF